MSMTVKYIFEFLGYLTAIIVDRYLHEMMVWSLFSTDDEIVLNYLVNVRSNSNHLSNTKKGFTLWRVISSLGERSLDFDRFDR